MEDASSTGMSLKFWRIDLDIDPEIRAGELSASTLQLVEIDRRRGRTAEPLSARRDGV